jgi:hypothetical protein
MVLEKLRKILIFIMNFRKIHLSVPEELRKLNSYIFYEFQKNSIVEFQKNV